MKATRCCHVEAHGLLQEPRNCRNCAIMKDHLWNVFGNGFKLGEIEIIYLFYKITHSYISSKLSFGSSPLALLVVQNGLRCEKSCLWGFANNKGADQPAHPHSLASAFVIRLLESIISRLATSEVSCF